MTQHRDIVILLVEDDEAHAEIVRRSLADFQIRHRLIHVSDGQAALDFLFREGQHATPTPQAPPLPDLVLLDLRLPKVDGLEVLRRIKAHPTLKILPTIILTTSADEADRWGAYQAGASSFLVKPIEFAEFMTLMHSFGFYWLNWNRFAAGE